MLHTILKAFVNNRLKFDVITKKSTIWLQNNIMVCSGSHVPENFSRLLPLPFCRSNIRTQLKWTTGMRLRSYSRKSSGAQEIAPKRVSEIVQKYWWNIKLLFNETPYRTESDVTIGTNHHDSIILLATYDPLGFSVGSSRKSAERCLLATPAPPESAVVGPSPEIANFATKPVKVI